mgnify:FL=1
MTKPFTRTGRLSKDGTRSDFHSKPLYKLLESTLPSAFFAAAGRIDTGALAEDLGIHRYTIYRWFNGAMMSVGAARKLAEMSAKSNDKKGELTTDLLKPFCGL